MPYTDTSTKQLIINVLTEDQYDNIETHNPSELYLITDDDSDISAGTGISIDESSEGVNIINHSNSTTTKSIQAIYPITIDAQGHISGSGTGIELGSDTTKYLRNDGTWQVVSSTDTKNTAGATDTSSKIYLVGALDQTANPQTYTDDQVYATSGQLDANKVRVAEAVTMQYNSTTKALDFIFS